MSVAVIENSAHEERLVAFELANEIYGVDIALINEIIRWRKTTQIPRTADEIEGVINLRGKITPVLDLRERLGLPNAERASETRIIVVEMANYTVGLVVDKVIGVERIAKDRIEPPDQLIADLDADYIRGVGKTDDKFIILLDMQRILRQN